MLKIAIRKMTEMYNSALVCNLSNLSSIEHPEQQNSRKNKKKNSASMLPPSATLTRGRRV